MEQMVQVMISVPAEAASAILHNDEVGNSQWVACIGESWPFQLSTDPDHLRAVLRGLEA